MTVTTRQANALHLYYNEGWSYRRIGQSLGSNPGTVYRLVERGKQRLLRLCSEEGGNASPRLKAFLAPSAKSSATRHVGRADARREELIGLLELRMQQRAESLAAIHECMSGESILPSHPLRNHWDQWELRYLARRPQSRGVPGSAYEARTCWRYCAAVAQGGEVAGAVETEGAVPALSPRALHLRAQGTEGEASCVAGQAEAQADQRVAPTLHIERRTQAAQSNGR